MVFGDGCGTQVTLDGSGSSDPDGDQLQYTWSSWMFGDMPGPVQTITLMPGNYWFTLTVDDGRGGRASQTVTVTVVDNVPPQIGAVFATPTVLGPPNHKMADIGFSMELNSECHQDFECRIVNVVSNEPIDGLGDGDTAPDWAITGPMSLQLRAERSGQGQGRIYTITIECTDWSGNSVRRTVTVVVPKH